MIWFRRINGIGFRFHKRKSWYVPITWQGFVYDFVQYSALIYFLFFQSGWTSLSVVVLILLISYFVKSAKSQTVEESVNT